MTRSYPQTPFYQAITDGAFPIIVSLARHDIDLAKAALDGGAFALKTHLNAYHRATGTTFGSFVQERPFYEQLSKLGAPLLVMAGQDIVPSPEEMDNLADLGFEGFNVYIDHLQPHLLQSRLRPMPALSSESSPQEIARIASIPGAMVEASIIEFSGYGLPLEDEDLERYRAIASSAGIPVIAPSQRKFVPEDMARLKEAGIAAPLLGAIVTGSTPQSMYEAVKKMALVP